MLGNILLLLMTALPLVGSPGPATLGIAATSAAFGIRRTVPYFLGIFTGTSVVIVATLTGIAGLLTATPAIETVMRILASLYILWLAYRIATAPILKEGEVSHLSPRFLSGFILAVINPKAYASMSSITLSVTLIADAPMADAGLKLLFICAAVAVVDAIWLTIGGAISRLWRRPKLGRAINLTFALLLVAAMVFVFSS
jgi:threonine/homoserine/homoserine lactone efflux protein